MKPTYELIGIKRHFWENYIRPLVFKRDNYACVICKSKKNLECNKTNYKKIPLSSIITLCNKCHTKIHPWYNIRK